MILGLGLDVVSVPDFAELLAEEGSAFAARSFTEAERAYAEHQARGSPALHLAGRWAAKEACLKALDQAAGRKGVEPGEVDLSSIEVRRDRRGRPALTLHEEAAALADRLGVAEAHLSLSHDGDVAAATVLLED